jgi:hypothetical protein
MLKNYVVVGIEIYKNDVRVVRKSIDDKTAVNGRFWFRLPEGDIVVGEGLRREEIYEFSSKSRANLSFVLSNTEIEFDKMLTLTYPADFPLDGRDCKRHLHAMLAWLRRRNIEAYCWFMEFQKRGAPHFHILVSGGDYIDRLDLSNRWYEVVGSGEFAHYMAGTNIRKPTKKRGLHFYGVKYAQKARQKSVPPDFRNVGRLWGCSRNVHPADALFVPVDSEASLSALLQNWRLSGEERKGYRILFGASDSVVSLLFDANYFSPGQ